MSCSASWTTANLLSFAALCSVSLCVFELKHQKFINISSRTLRPLPVTHSQDLEGLRSSTSGVGEPHVCLVVVVFVLFFRVTKACANPDSILKVCNYVKLILSMQTHWREKLPVLEALWLLLVVWVVLCDFEVNQVLVSSRAKDKRLNCPKSNTIRQKNIYLNLYAVLVWL